DTSTTKNDTLTLHDALPISRKSIHKLYGSDWWGRTRVRGKQRERERKEKLDERTAKRGRKGGKGTEQNEKKYKNTLDRKRRSHEDRKSTRLNSSHLGISYAV